MTAGRILDRDRRGSCLVLAFLAAGTLEAVRLGADGRLWCSAVDVAVTGAATVAIFWISGGQAAAAKRDGARRIGPGETISLAGMIALPVIVEMLMCAITAEGEAFELVMLTILRNAALGTAAFASRRPLARASFLMSSFLALFAVSISDTPITYVWAAVFAVAGLWTLMAAYWARVQGQLATRSERRAPLRLGVLVVVCGILAITGGLAMGFRRELISLPGFMPTSGGHRWSDPYARQGIGDGDMLASAKNDPMTFGPVESEMFLDSDMPSLYDMLDERYGNPTTRPRRVQKAIGLGGRTTRERPDKPVQSQRSGREFAMARRKTTRGGTAPGDTHSRDLLYVLGAVPLHLTLETYDDFDGASWDHVTELLALPPLSLNSCGKEPWIEFQATPEPWVVSRERHALKVINFKSRRFPSPPLLNAVSIDRVSRLDFFSWTSDGVLQIEGQEHLPQFTVVHLINNVVGSQKLRMYGLPFRIAAMAAPYLQLPEVESNSQLKQLAQRWTLGVPAGWPQVEAIISHLRSEFAHDEASLAPEGCADVIGHFLAHGRGPDYMFASTATMLLRRLGYPTRLVSGFYADPKRYDNRAGQTAVNRDDAHVWAEVCVSGGTWVTVEPTPGYEPPRTVQTWNEWAWAGVASTGRWIATHWAIVTASMIVVALAIWRRQSLADAVASAVWRRRLLHSPRRAILATVWLLEWRSRLAGRSRPRAPLFPPGMPAGCGPADRTRPKPSSRYSFCSIGCCTHPRGGKYRSPARRFNSSAARQFARCR